MSHAKVDLPYWDGYLALYRQAGLSYDIGTLHSHYGCWDDPSWSNLVPEHYALAAERMAQLVCEAGGVAPGQRVLDVGCGLGTVVASLNERTSDLSLVGLNIDGRQLDIARRSVHARQGNRVGWVEADGCRLPFADASFDTVLALECTMHFSSRARFLRDARRVLRPGGRLALCEHFAARPRAGDPDRPKPSRIWGSFLEPIASEQWQAMARAAGLEQVDQRDVTRHAVPTCPGVRKMLWRALRWPQNLGAYATVWLAEGLMRCGLLRYKIAAFEAR